MLPPVLEIYVLWHPDDADGAQIAKDVIDRFHGVAYSGLIGGAVEVHIRSAAWGAPRSAPRPIPFPSLPPPNGVALARYTAVVPVLGNGMAGAVQDREGGWWEYIRQLVNASKTEPASVRMFPYQLHRAATDQTELGNLMTAIQCIAAPDPNAPAEPRAQIMCRDLAQFIAQWISAPGAERLKVFISHTKRASEDEGPEVARLIALVRTVIANTRLTDFFDAHDLESGADFEAQLLANAARGALIGIRTEIYASREWCQLEMITSKDAGLPIVMLDALETWEERGSFVMDHVPRVAMRRAEGAWCEPDVFRALGMLVDEALKRALWHRQAELARSVPELDVSWWAPHAPEPITFTQWLWREKEQDNRGTFSRERPLRILHPDPPLSSHERDKLNRMAALCGLGHGLDIMTPRLLAARGGSGIPSALLSSDALTNKRIQLSVSDSSDLARLGLVESHFRMALGEIARCVLVSGGKLAYGGYLSPEGYTNFLVSELGRYGRRDRPLLVCLAWQNHRSQRLSVLEGMKNELGLKAEFVYLDPDGQAIDPALDRGEDPRPVDDPDLCKQALTSMRRYLASRTNGLVLLGGKQHGFLGEMPGLMEEALLALAAHKPIYLAGGFGGVTLDVAKALAVDDGRWLPSDHCAPAEDPRLALGRSRLEAVAREPGWSGMANGLSEEENRRLAAAHRPSDIAALIGMGFGRMRISA